MLRKGMSVGMMWKQGLCAGCVPNTCSSCNVCPESTLFKPICQLRVEDFVRLWLLRHCCWYLHAFCVPLLTCSFKCTAFSTYRNPSTLSCPLPSHVLLFHTLSLMCRLHTHTQLAAEHSDKHGSLYALCTHAHKSNMQQSILADTC
jgi:hypothetical protein